MQENARSGRFNGHGSLLALCLAACLISVSFARTTPTQESTELRAVTPRDALFEDESRDIGIFNVASPSVVHINTVSYSRRQFSRRILQTPGGSGTGFVWDEQGHIVTNFHVIQAGSQILVTLADQSEWEAEVVGAFPDRDLAVLRISPTDVVLTPLALGSSADLQVGQHVYAIGNPFGLDQTMTRGIVSALEREIPSDNNRTLRGVIQTDAAINPGNSGGPLLDSAGRLIGVNTAIFSPSGSSVGIGFAIPVDEVNRIIPRLIRDGRFNRPALGIELAPPRFLVALGLPPGVAVLGVARNGPADQAGIRPFLRRANGRIIAGDVITQAADRSIRTLDDLHAVLEQYEAGDTLTLTVQRGRQERAVTITLAESRGR
ncbi:MAG: S1C family serine protease [Burkholderiaceae bacterium]